MEIVSDVRCFEGRQLVVTHPSDTTQCDMTFGLYLPPEAEYGPVPVIWYLSGLTCNHENAMTKAGLQAVAAEEGVAIVFPDTSPRGEGVADDQSYDLGQGAGFYVNATEAPWAPHFNMWNYITEELPMLIGDRFPIDMGLQSIMGHSMGGHGALTIAMHHPERFASVSAFAPITHPSASEWGQKQLRAYLGENPAKWAEHDSTLLMRERGFDGPVLVDQGADDQFIELLKPEALAEAMAARRQAGTFRLQKGYDHSYFFVASFAPEHVEFHADALARVTNIASP
ncbi:MAG: S-formylglutathione hydrolase [Halieaceae bacterium]|jgi:S-formylglutathione hydrolase|nr:S-formylglutathione hydrolase [Halieaceae bacterium]